MNNPLNHRITEEYRALNAELHRVNAVYGSRGDKWADRVRQLAKRYRCESILDYGCGKGSLVDALGADIAVGYDPAMSAYSQEPTPADMVVCVDMLEHCEPEKLDAVLEHLWTLTRVVMFAVVATRASNKRLADGRNTHLIVEQREWWVKRMERYFDCRVADASTKEHWAGRGIRNPPLRSNYEFSAVCFPHPPAESGE